MTTTQERALRIIAEYTERNGPIRATAFALAMWPDAPGWDKLSKAGNNGSRRGAGMWRAGGGLLGKLKKQGFVEERWSYYYGGKGGNERVNHFEGYVLTKGGVDIIGSR